MDKNASCTYLMLVLLVFFSSGTYFSSFSIISGQKIYYCNLQKYLNN